MQHGFYLLNKCLLFWQNDNIINNFDSSITRYSMMQLRRDLKRSQRFSHFLFDLAAIHRCLKYESFSCVKKCNWFLKDGEMQPHHCRCCYINEQIILGNRHYKFDMLIYIKRNQKIKWLTQFPNILICLLVIYIIPITLFVTNNQGISLHSYASSLGFGSHIGWWSGIPGNCMSSIE